MEDLEIKNKEDVLFEVKLPGLDRTFTLDKISCPLCKRTLNNYKGIVRINDLILHIDYCQGDDIWWVNPRPQRAFYEELYSRYFYHSPIPEQFGYASLELDSLRRREKAVKNLDDIEKYIQKINRENFLEIGCATGELLFEAQKRGFKNVLGIEIEKQCCHIAQDKGLKVFCGSFESADNFSSPFDLIFADNVIEHLLDPQGAIAKCSKIQMQGSLLILRLPETSNEGPRLKLIDHTYHFTRNSISKLLRICGYEIVNMFHSGTFFGENKIDRIDNMTVVSKRRQ